MDGFVFVGFAHIDEQGALLHEPLPFGGSHFFHSAQHSGPSGARLEG